MESNTDGSILSSTSGLQIGLKGLRVRVSNKYKFLALKQTIIVIWPRLGTCITAQGWLTHNLCDISHVTWLLLDCLAVDIGTQLIATFSRAYYMQHIRRLNPCSQTHHPFYSCIVATDNLRVTILQCNLSLYNLQYFCVSHPNTFWLNAFKGANL